MLSTTGRSSRSTKMPYHLLPCLTALFLLNLPSSHSTNCPVFINEININGPSERSHPHDAEFVELKSDCAGTGQRFPLRNYKLVMWKGPKQGTEEPAQVDFIMNLDTFSFRTDSPYFVIAASGLYSRLKNGNLSGEIVSAVEFLPDMDKKEGFLENGRERAMGLAVYRDGVELRKGDPLSQQTAFLMKLDDIVVYHERGNGQQFADMFFKEYKLPGISDSRVGVLVKDMPLKNAKNVDYALSFCCPRSIPKWPLGFQRALMTPGTANLCDQKDQFVVQMKKNTVSHRCNPVELGKTAKAMRLVPGKKARSVAARFPEMKASVKALFGPEMEQTMDSVERQVTLLASVLGGMVSILGIAGIVVGAVYVKMKKATRAVRYRMGSLMAGDEQMDEQA